MQRWLARHGHERMNPVTAAFVEPQAPWDLGKTVEPEELNEHRPGPVDNGNSHERVDNGLLRLRRRCASVLIRIAAKLI
jgi:hypothetical protein